MGLYTPLSALVSSRDRSEDQQWRCRGGHGIDFEEYDTESFKTVDHVVTSPGIGRSAWFKDPDGNTIAVFQPE